MVKWQSPTRKGQVSFRKVSENGSKARKTILKMKKMSTHDGKCGKIERMTTGAEKFVNGTSANDDCGIKMARMDDDDDSVFLIALVWIQGCLIGEILKDSTLWLPLDMYWYNTNYHSDTKTTLFEIVHGQTPSLHIPYVAKDSRVELVDMTLQEREKVIGMLKFNLKKAQDRMKSQSLGSPPFGSFIMSLEESNDLDISDAKPIDPVLEASPLLKFDMHLYKSSLSETHVKWLTKCYDILEDLHPRVVLEGLTMDALPNDAIGLYAHHFQQGGLRDKFFLVNRRAAPIAMAWRHHDSSVANPFPKPSKFNASDVAKLREDSKGKVVTMAEFLCLHNFKGCKVVAGAFLPPDSARVTYLASPAEWLEDIPPKTGDMEIVEILCRKVLDDKEKKKKKVEAKTAANVLNADIQPEKVSGKRCAGKEGTSRKKRRVHQQTLVHPDSEHVSSPVPLNHAKPLEALANEEHALANVSAGQMDVLRNQIDEHATHRLIANVEEHVVGEEKDQENVDLAFVTEGHDDNEDGLSDLHQCLESVERPVHDTVVPDA
ncbi:hypothetical protein Tco_1561370 [Tanacetum coccineum]